VCNPYVSTFEGHGRARITSTEFGFGGKWLEGLFFRVGTLQAIIHSIAQLRRFCGRPEAHPANISW
jgi:hypothetical protein